MSRLRSFDVPVHQRATVVLKAPRRFAGESPPAAQSHGDIIARQLPLLVGVSVDHVELLIVDALGPSDEFGAGPRGAVYVVGPNNGDRVFITRLSLLLDEATNVIHCLNRGGGQFFESNDLFITEKGTAFFPLRERAASDRRRSVTG